MEMPEGPSNRLKVFRLWTVIFAGAAKGAGHQVGFFGGFFKRAMC